MSPEMIKALGAIQAKLNAPKNQTNNFGGYDYRSCEDVLQAVKPLLAENHAVLRLADELLLIGDRYYVRATATLDVNGESVSTTAYAREADAKKGMDASQITGATSSYARKYALNGLFCIDDNKDADTDENTIMRRSAQQQQQKPVAKLGTDESKTSTTNVSQSAVNPPICTECGCEITQYGKHSAQDMAHVTKAKYGRVLCIECAKDEKARMEAGACSPQLGA